MVGRLPQVVGGRTRRLIGIALLGVSAGCGPAPESAYVDEVGLFRVDRPRLRNPFVRSPTAAVAGRPADGGSTMTWTVIDLGEAWRVGVRAPDAIPPGAGLGELCDAEAARWLRERPAGALSRPPGAPEPVLILEEPVDFAATPGLARIYLADAAALIHRERDGRPRRALVDVAVARAPHGGLLFAVAQFDMPMDQWDFFIEDVGRDPQRVLDSMARDDLAALRAAVGTLQAVGIAAADPGS